MAPSKYWWAFATCLAIAASYAMHRLRKYNALVSNDVLRAFQAFQRQNARRLISSENVDDGPCVHVIGCGVCGPLIATFLGERGYRVIVYEKRPQQWFEDTAGKSKSFSRHVGVLVSERGIYHLRRFGLTQDEIDLFCRPLEGRKVHAPGGGIATVSWADAMFAVDRERLVVTLIQKAKSTGRVEFLFSHEVSTIDCEGERMKINFVDKDDCVMADVLLGCDGVASAVRKYVLSREEGFSVETSCESHGYKSLRLFSNNQGKPMFNQSFIHTWPRKNILLHAMPGINDPAGDQNYFNCTYVAPLQYEVSNVHLHLANLFPDAYRLQAGSLLEQFSTCHLSRLQNVQLNQLHSASCSAVVLGDAAHPVVPYIGQGLVSSVEDCAVLADIIVFCNDDWAQIPTKYNDVRLDDVRAMQLMAEEQYHYLFFASGHYWEMWRRKYMTFMNRLLPSLYPHSLYAMLCDPTLSYSEVLKRKKLQNDFLWGMSIGRL